MFSMYLISILSFREVFIFHKFSINTEIDYFDSQQILMLFHMSYYHIFVMHVLYHINKIKTHVNIVEMKDMHVGDVLHDISVNIKCTPQ